VHDSSAPAFNATLINRPEEMHFGKGKGGRGGIEFAYEHYRGEGTQDIATGRYLSLDQGRINGPQTVSDTAQVQHGHVAYNLLFSFGRHFDLEPAFGIAYDKFTATALSRAPGSSELSINGQKWGGLAALTPRWNFNQYFGFEARFSLSGDFKNTEITGSNLAFVLSPSSHFSLKAGYYSRGTQFETPSSHSNVETNFHGFSGGLTLVF